MLLTWVCKAAIMINLSKYPWTKDDYKMLKFVTNRCVVHYDDAPCLKKFIKVAPQEYRAICGA